jgi:hypothetical protein
LARCQARRWQPVLVPRYPPLIRGQCFPPYRPDRHVVSKRIPVAPIAEVGRLGRGEIDGGFGWRRDEGRGGRFGKEPRVLFGIRRDDHGDGEWEGICAVGLRRMSEPQVESSRGRVSQVAIAVPERWSWP